MKTESINLFRLKAPEFIQFSSDVTTASKTHNPVALDIDEPYQEMLGLTNEIIDLYDPKKSSPLSDELILLDNRRDSAIIGIIKFLESHTYHISDEIKKGANLLLTHINSYGTGIARMNYPSETAILSSIVKDWTSQTDLAAAVALLRLGEWKIELEASNAAFNAKYLERAESNSKESDETVSKKRLEVARAWDDLTKAIESHYNLKNIKKAGFEPYESLIKNLNAIIDKYNMIIANRTNKKPAAAKATGNTSGSSSVD